jgi:Vanillate O-demethylase oxygenase C-terminal domain
MDLSHIDFLHADTLGGGSIVSAKREIHDTERSLTVRWSQSGFPPSPLHVSLGSCSADAKLDRITEVIWYPPGAMVLTNGFAPMGAAEHEFANSIGAHIMVPETRGTLHYFYSTTRNFKKDDAQFNATYAQRRDHVFLTEDGPMLEAVQSRMGSHELFDLRPLLLKTDEPAIRVRRKLEAMIRAEHTVDADTTGRVEDSLV